MQIPHNVLASKIAPRQRAKGNTLAILLALTVAFIGAVFFFAFNFTRSLGGHMEQRTAIEAAALTAAQQLSRIVIEDPNYGYISLSDYLPIGSHTIAQDKEPLPVLGINTILSTARLDLIIAESIGNNTMRALALADVNNAHQAARRLVFKLRDALEPDADGFVDLDGNAVTPYKLARDMYLANNIKMSGGGEFGLRNFKLSLGWLDGGSTTITKVPQPEAMAQLPPLTSTNGNYKAFVNVEAHGHSFFFAGLSTAPTLVDSGNFREFIADRTPSIVRAEADHAFKEVKDGSAPVEHIMHAVACAQPGANPETPPTAALCLSFPDGLPSNIQSPGDLMDEPQLTVNPGELWMPPDDDWPDESPKLVPATIEGDAGPPVSSVWAAGLYHWFRSVGNKLRIKDAKKLVEMRFGDYGSEGQMSTVVGLDLIPPARASKPSAPASLETGIFCTLPGTANDLRRDNFLLGDDAAKQNYRSISQYTNITLPANCFSVGVSPEGNAVTGDGELLTLDTVHSFWLRIAETNAAAHICRAMADSALKQARSEIAEANEAIAQTNREIQQLNADLATASGDQRAVIQNRINFLTFSRLPELNQQLTSNNEIVETVQIAYDNASAIASISDTIAQNQRTLTAKGCTRDGAQYVLAGVRLTPRTKPPLSIEALINGTASSGDPENTPWTSRNLYFYDMKKITAQAAPAHADFLPQARASSVVPPGLRRMILLELDGMGYMHATVLPNTPFKGVPVSHKQILAASVRAITTGSTIPVTWTMAMRDQCATLGHIKGGKHGGQALAGPDLFWCEEPAYGSGRNEHFSREVRRQDQRQSEGGGRQGNDKQADNIDLSAPYGQRKHGDERLTYRCGGLGLEYQLRAPLVGNLGLAEGATAAVTGLRQSEYLGVPAFGQATAEVNGKVWNLPGCENFVIRVMSGQPANVYTLAPDSKVPTCLCPQIPDSLM